jgi:ABC-type branched-subunit amino acid transport system ATPase component
VLGVIGPNGAGKTTLISMLAGALAPSSGQVRLESKNIEGRPSYNVARRGVGRSFQQTATFGNETVGENLARALVFSRRSSFDGGFHALIASTGLLDVLDSRSADLPYGKQKLLGLLMTVATRPRLLLMDEPAAGLETSERLLIDRIVDLVVSDGTAVLLVEHDMDLVKRICPRVIVMDAGALLAEGPPEDVFRDLNVISAYLGTPPEDPVLDTVLGEGGHP